MIIDLGEAFDGDGNIDPDVIEKIVSDIIGEMPEQEPQAVVPMTKEEQLTHLGVLIDKLMDVTSVYTALVSRSQVSKDEE